MSRKLDEGKNMETRIEKQQRDSSKAKSKTEQVKKETAKKLKENLK